MLPVLWNVPSTASCLTGRRGPSAPTPVGWQVCVHQKVSVVPSETREEAEQQLNEGASYAHDRFSHHQLVAVSPLDAPEDQGPTVDIKPATSARF